jgi:hypothetical protein
MAFPDQIDSTMARSAPAPSISGDERNSLDQREPEQCTDYGADQLRMPAIEMQCAK